MGSTPTVDPIPWQPPPYNAYRDCSLGICTMYCPQWCTLFFPPPPDSSGSGMYFSPLVVSVIVILASALILVSYFTIFKKSCSRRRPVGSNSITGDEDRDLTHNVLSRNALPAGLEESVIRSITVWKYKKGERVVEGTDCSVCLSEFQDDESLRLLPKCNHAFHLPCIDTWLKSHSNCPLCRANVAPSVNSSPMQEPPPLVPGSPLPTEDEDDMPFSGDEVVVAVFGDEVSASPGSASREGQGHVQVAHGVPEQHAEEDGDDGRINPQNIGPSKSFHGDNSTGRANYASESRSAVSPGK